MGEVSKISSDELRVKHEVYASRYGISTQVMHSPGRNLAPKSSSLTKFELHSQIYGTESL